MTTEARCSHCGGEGAHYLHCPFVGCEIPLIDLHPSKTLENLLDDLCWAVERVNKAAHWGQRDQIPEEKKEIQRIRGEILTRAAAWEKAAIARPEIEGARDLAFELGADICSDHCDLDPEDNQHMAHCHWCDQATRVYQMLKAALGASPRPVSGSEPEHPLKDFFTGDSHACVTGWNMIGSKADCKSCNPGAKGFPEPEQGNPGPGSKGREGN